MMLPNDSSAVLRDWLSRHRTGEESAANEVLAHCQQRLKILTRQMLRRFPQVRLWEDTSDVFQNVQIRLLRTLRDIRFETPTDFLRLAACQIRRELIDLSRQRRPVPVDPTGSDSGTVAEGDDDPYRLAIWEEIHSRIAAMPEADRQLFDLLYYQGLRQAEAAALLGIPIRTFKRRWQVARTRLMTALGSEPPFG
jgi:RNA polymerase sigma-70 factor (ECF subfamily)